MKFNCWNPSAGDPRQLEYAGQRPVQEVFEELKYRLESQGYLRQYFLLNREREEGREIPKDTGVFFIIGFGSNEGMLLRAYLRLCENDKPITKSFITGKALG